MKLTKISKFVFELSFEQARDLRLEIQEARDKHDGDYNILREIYDELDVYESELRLG